LDDGRVIAKKLLDAGVPPQQILERMNRPDIKNFLSEASKRVLEQRLFAQSQETARHNLAGETAAMARDETSQRRADTADRNADTNSRKADAMIRKLSQSGQPGAAGEPDASVGEQVATGQPLTEIIPGYGKEAATMRTAGRLAGIKAIQAETGMSAGEAGKELAARGVDYKSGRGASLQITKDISAFRPYKEMLDKNVDIAIDLGRKITSTNAAIANKPINWLKQNAGDNPDTAEYLAQMAFVQTEAARVLNNPRLVGQLTDEAKREMAAVINGNMPIKATERVLRRVQQDGENRIAAMVKQQRALRTSPGGESADKPSAGGIPQGWTVKER
jgi:hypothetical protein